VKKGEICPVQRTLTSGPITGSILLGLCMGSGVAISMQYGSGEYDKMRQSVFRSFALIAGMALADAIGIGYYLVRHKKVTQ
jgi:Na+-driven multidrug efflux pump